MQFNWIDSLILIIIVLYTLEGWQDGVIKLGSSLVAFLGSLWLAVKYHGIVGGFLGEKFGISPAWTTVIGYLVVGVLAEWFISEGVRFGLRKLPQKWIDSRVDKGLGAVMAAVNSLIITAFVLLIILALPMRGTVKKDINNSVLGSRLVVLAERYGGNVKSSVDSVAKEAVKFLTIKPQSGETVELTHLTGECELSVNRAAETEMLELVNKERTKAGVSILSEEGKIVEVARKHSRDMFERKYFSHQSPEGTNVADRMDKGGVEFTLAGENLAYAPDVQTAHEGLMNSEGHRRNVLEGEFNRIGIGVIDGGSCGMMFTQNFAD